MCKEEKLEYMEKIYKDVAERTLKRLEEEKATKISRRTELMIAFTERLFYVVYRS